jgi:hypothetical protein
MQLDMYDNFEEAEKGPASILPSAPPDDINYKMSVLLAEFERCGYITTFAVERLVHRGQAVIGEMRSRGHIIDTTAVGDAGMTGYIYRGFVAGMKRVSKSVKEKYYSTAHWKRTAFLRKEMDGFQCVQCKAKGDLETHHCRYNLFAENILRDLMTLCRQCHQILHMDISGSGVHFPRYVPAELFDKIVESNDNHSDSDDSGEQGSCQGDDTSGCAERQRCCGSDEDATGTTGSVAAFAEPSGGTEIAC